MSGRDGSVLAGQQARTLQQRYLRASLPAMPGYLVVLLVLLVPVVLLPRVDMPVAWRAVIGMATFGPGFLQVVRVLPSPPGAMLWVPPLMIGVYGVARLQLSRRYQ